MFDEKTRDYLLISILAMIVFVFLVIPKNTMTKSLYSKVNPEEIKADTKPEETKTV